MQAVPGAMEELTAQVPPVIVTPVPVAVIAEGTTAAPPVFVAVMVSGVLTPIWPVPKAPLVKLSGPGCTAVPESDTEFEPLDPPE